MKIIAIAIPLFSTLCFDLRIVVFQVMTMHAFLNKKILVGICGGIAAYKSAFLVRELVRLGACVRVVMTQSATQFITPLTLQGLSGNDVRCDVFDPQAERAMGHIELARWADGIVIAPLSANTMAKMAQGIADDLLTTLYLVAEVPIWVCPAMNHSMWAHPATQANASRLKQFGVRFIGPESGSQACGEEGYGRMSEVVEIVDALQSADIRSDLKDQTIVITAGPTQEPIDPVRYLTNRSSGKMGYALARAAVQAGARVILISGPSAERIPSGVEFYAVHTASEMLDAVLSVLTSGCVFIGAAAVADYHIAEPAKEKIKKSNTATLTVTLKPNLDILATVSASKKAQYVVGFAAETEHVIEYAKAKLQTKNLDMIIANQVGMGQGFEVDCNQVTLLTKDTQKMLPLMHKSQLASEIIAILAVNLQNVALKI